MAIHLPGDFVRGVRLFRDLTHEEIQILLDAAEEVEFQERSRIFEEGEKGRALYIVVEGQVRISIATPTLTATELVTVGPVGVFGESSFFHRSQHHATAHCLTPVKVIRIRRGKYRDLLKSNTIAAYKLAANAAELLGERLQQTDEWIERMLQGRQEAELVAKWKQFRRGISRDFSNPSSGFTL